MICNICEQEFEFLQRHHIHSKSLGGSITSLHNKTKLCPNCHESVHRGEYILEGNFSTSKGYILIWRKKGEPSITGIDDPPCYRIGKRIT